MNQSESNQTTALAIAGNTLPITSMSEIATAGALLAQSGMFGVKNDAGGFVVVATCVQQGISLMEFHRTYHLVNGAPSMRADAMLAEFRKRGGRYIIVENTAARAAARFTFEGNECDFEFTMDDARATGDCFEKDGATLKYTWQKRPADMLWARLVSRSVRRLCPEINAGLYASEEVQDFDGHQPRAAGGDPAPIDHDEAARRAKRVTPEAVSAAPADTTIAPDAGDCTTCPIGGEGYEGRKWEDFADDELATALECGAPELRPGHLAAIRRVQELRKASAPEIAKAAGALKQTGGVK